MSFVLFDDESSLTLRPFTFTRPVGALRIGILTIAEKWAKYLDQPYSFLTAAYLQELFPEEKSASLFINASVCPDDRLSDAILALKDGESLVAGAILVALKAGDGKFPVQLSGSGQIRYSTPFNRLVYPEDIFRLNESELKKDFDLVTRGRSSVAVSSTNTILGDNFFAEPGATAECSTFNTLNGPVYLGAQSEVWEGCHIRGSFSLGDHAQLKMGARIYGGTTIGPGCRIGGEVNNSVIFGNSSKGHDGYLGNSVLGEWCNIGAGSDNSNMKNNYSEVKIWDYTAEKYRNTRLQFCGLFMGDHAKCGIGTMFNTGTVAGVGANIFGGGYQNKFIPDFSWGNNGSCYEPDKFIQTVESVFRRRNRRLDAAQEKMLRFLADPSARDTANQTRISYTIHP
jgi:UDP-N-acetylglucosamine diphosphorylase/glucosamine-1-phosphate N-acetyltransferase